MQGRREAKKGLRKQKQPVGNLAFYTKSNQKKKEFLFMSSALLVVHSVSPFFYFFFCMSTKRRVWLQDGTWNRSTIVYMYSFLQCCCYVQQVKQGMVDTIPSLKGGRRVFPLLIVLPSITLCIQCIGNALSLPDIHTHFRFPILLSVRSLALQQLISRNITLLALLL